MRRILAAIVAISILLILLVGAWVFSLRVSRKAEPHNTYTLLSKPFDTGGGTVVAIRLENRVEGFANKGDTVYILKLK